jgi:hypothetical protein
MATVVPIDNTDLERSLIMRIGNIHKKKYNYCLLSCFILLFMLLSMIGLGSTYIYYTNNIVPTNSNPSADAIYYNYFDIIYNYNGYYSNYTVDNTSGNYKGNFYFTITDTTNRVTNNLICEEKTTPNINIANEYFPVRYLPYQMVNIYFKNGDSQCTLYKPKMSNMTTFYQVIAMISIVIGGIGTILGIGHIVDQIINIIKK